MSKANSEVAILINGQNIHGYYSMPNGTIGFNHLLKDLKTEQHNRYYIPATGVYSHRPQAFLDNNGYAYIRLNLLEAKNS